MFMMLAVSLAVALSAADLCRRTPCEARTGRSHGAGGEWRALHGGRRKPHHKQLSTSSTTSPHTRRDATVHLAA